MSKKFNLKVSVLLIAINLLIAFSHSSVSNNLVGEADSHSVNNYLQDNSNLHNVIITEYSSLKISTSLENYSKQSNLFQQLTYKEVEQIIVSIASFTINQIRKELSLQRKTNILFPFHDHG